VWITGQNTVPLPVLCRRLSVFTAQGIYMSDRSWFYAANGQQQGPYPDVQLRDLIARGTIRPDTLVWSEGMSGWQKAGEIPGLMSGESRPPAMPQAGAPPLAGTGGYSSGSGTLSIDPPLWAFLGRGLLMALGLIFVVPAPWTSTSFYRWMTSWTQVPGRPNLAFTGQPFDIWYVLVAMGLMNYVSLYDTTLQLIAIPLSAFLAWMVLRWIASHLTSNGQPLPIAFNGSAITFIGWQLLLYVSFITIIGWAWVAAAWTRWICRHISGTRREIVFNGTGLQILWRTIVFSIGCGFLIPIPWVMRWYTRWYVSQFALIERA
jgi:GYF domain 2